MKSILLFTFFFIISITSYAQDIIEFFFDGDDLFSELLIIDTVNNQDNIWEIGEPLKDGFEEAYSLPNVLGTKLTEIIPTNKTSSFIVKTLEFGGYLDYGTALIIGQYWVNSDSLNDFGMIEASFDNGENWLDLLDDSIIDYYNLYYNKPILTGNSGGWKYFELNLVELGPHFEVDFNDTIFYRFSYITDSIQDSLPGLMFDNLHFENWFEGIHERNTFNSIAYPSPAIDNITISFNSAKFNMALIEVIDISGKVVKAKRADSDINNIDISGSPSGVYYYRIKSGNEISTGSFIKI